MTQTARHPLSFGEGELREGEKRAWVHCSEYWYCVLAKSNKKLWRSFKRKASSKRFTAARLDEAVIVTTCKDYRDKVCVLSR